MYHPHPRPGISIRRWRCIARKELSRVGPGGHANYGRDKAGLTIPPYRSPARNEALRSSRSLCRASRHAAQSFEYGYEGGERRDVKMHRAVASQDSSYFRPIR